MEDPSVDISDFADLGRKEILAKLGQSPSLHDGSDKLHIKFKKFLQKNHPIHGYLSQLSNNDLKLASLTIFGSAGNYDYDRIKRGVANEMFKKFPRAPLATLIWILRNRKIPTEIEFNNIRKRISENPSVRDLSRETDDLIMNVTIDESDNDKVSFEGEMTRKPKRKQKGDSINSNSASKMPKRNNVTGMTNEQVEISSITGKKFENRNSNNISYINSV